MQARIKRMDEIYCVELVGKISYDTLEKFVAICKKDLVGNSVVLNCEELSFVGSVGIMDFLVNLAALHKHGTNIKYVGVLGDFVRLAKSFAHTNNIVFDQYKSDYLAIQAIRNPPAEVVASAEASDLGKDLS